ncbi:hypothetical protein [Photorhabdus thracensis]|uniref:hypothetical protein n=1 Tax=Photorhabdus thracensis TaxID=230089 RepID=UPI001300EFED|nr:hypothetical protein [Photorhabdus thracensis]
MVSLVGLGWWFWGEHQTTDTETFNHLLRGLWNSLGAHGGGEYAGFYHGYVVCQKQSD